MTILASVIVVIAAIIIVHTALSYCTGFRYYSVFRLQKPTGKCLKGF